MTLGKFSPKTIQDLESYGKPLIFVDSNTLYLGHSCVTTDLEDSVIRALEYFLDHGHKEIGLLVGQEETADATPLTDGSPVNGPFNSFSRKKDFMRSALFLLVNSRPSRVIR